MKLDILVFTAHPDDAELGMGGTIAKSVAEGRKVGIIDLTEAELSSNGTVESRKLETEEASQILGIHFRDNLKFQDGKVIPNDEFVMEVVKRIRFHKPKIIFAPYFNDRHPDHIGTSKIVKEAMFFSGLKKIETLFDGKLQAPYRAEKLYYFMQMGEFKPSFIVDISDHFETKMASIKAYKTQFFNPELEGEKTLISDPKFLKFIEARAVYFGFQIRKGYGEPFFSDDLIELDL